MKTKLLDLILIGVCFLFGCGERVGGKWSGYAGTLKKLRQIESTLNEFDRSMVDSLQKTDSAQFQSMMVSQIKEILGNKYHDDFLRDSWRHEFQFMLDNDTLVIRSFGPNGREDQENGDDVGMVISITGPPYSPFGYGHLFGSWKQPASDKEMPPRANQ